jgi:hypothetical protein
VENRRIIKAMLLTPNKRQALIDSLQEPRMKKSNTFHQAVGFGRFFFMIKQPSFNQAVATDIMLKTMP